MLLRAAAGCLIAALVSGQTSSPTIWVATSNTALSITGDIGLTSSRLRIAGRNFPLTLVREIEKDQLASAGKIVDLVQTPSSAKLFRTLISRQTSLKNGNTLCGPDTDAVWILAVYQQRDLSLAIFSGQREPKIDSQAVQSGHDLCGTYLYSMPANRR